jgi:hypothetical protein
MTERLSEAQIEQFIRDGYVVARGLLAPGLVADTRERLLAAMGVDPAAPETWKGKSLSPDPAVIALTAACRTEAVEGIAEQLVGPEFLRGLCRSPYLESQGVAPAIIPGYIPVLNFPTPGPRRFQRPTGYHIDGMRLTTLWPVWHYLILFAYLSDVAEYGGATTLLPGSHRQVFAHWVRAGHPGSTHPPELAYADPLPLPGRAGDVIFMHYLTVHSGSANHSDAIRVGLNAVVMPDPARPYRRKPGPPGPDWTPLDTTLRTDTLPSPGG